MHEPVRLVSTALCIRWTGSPALQIYPCCSCVTLLLGLACRGCRGALVARYRNGCRLLHPWVERQYWAAADGSDCLGGRGRRSGCSTGYRRCLSVSHTPVLIVGQERCCLLGGCCWRSRDAAEYNAAAVQSCSRWVTSVSWGLMLAGDEACICLCRNG